MCGTVPDASGVEIEVFEVFRSAAAKGDAGNFRLVAGFQDLIVATVNRTAYRYRRSL